MSFNYRIWVTKKTEPEDTWEANLHGGIVLGKAFCFQSFGLFVCETSRRMWYLRRVV